MKYRNTKDTSTFLPLIAPILRFRKKNQNKTSCGSFHYLEDCLISKLISISTATS